MVEKIVDSIFAILGNTISVNNSNIVDITIAKEIHNKKK